MLRMLRPSSAQPLVHTDKHISTRTKCCTLIGCCLLCPNIEHDSHGLFWATITWLVHFLISGTTLGSSSDWLSEWDHFTSFSDSLIFKVAPLSILFSAWLLRMAPLLALFVIGYLKWRHFWISLYRNSIATPCIYIRTPFQGPKIRRKIPSVWCLIPMLVTLVTSVLTRNS